MRPNLVQYTGMLRIKYVEFVWKYTGEWYVFDTYRLDVKTMIYYCNINIWMEIEKSKVLIQFLLIFRQSGDVLFFLYARRLRGYTTTVVNCCTLNNNQGERIIKYYCMGYSIFQFSCYWNALVGRYIPKEPFTVWGFGNCLLYFECDSIG